MDELSDKNSLPVSIERYRVIMEDDASSDEQIIRRIRYLEAFCANIIKSELDPYNNK